MYNSRALEERATDSAKAKRKIIGASRKRPRTELLSRRLHFEVEPDNEAVALSAKNEQHPGADDSGEVLFETAGSVRQRTR